jgi:hypothetical protein
MEAAAGIIALGLLGLAAQWLAAVINRRKSK